VESNRECISVVHNKIHEDGMVGSVARAIDYVLSDQVRSSDRDREQRNLRGECGSGWIRWCAWVVKAQRNQSGERGKPYLAPALLGLNQKLDYVHTFKPGSGNFNLGLTATVDSIRGAADLNYRVSKSWDLYGGAWLERDRLSGARTPLSWGAQFGARIKWR